MPQASSFDNPAQNRNRVLALGQIEEDIKDDGGFIEPGDSKEQLEFMTLSYNPVPRHNTS